jgi:hypothetical protein
VALFVGKSAAVELPMFVASRGNMCCAHQDRVRNRYEVPVSWRIWTLNDGCGHMHYAMATKKKE